LVSKRSSFISKLGDIFKTGFSNDFNQFRLLAKVFFSPQTTVDNQH